VGRGNLLYLSGWCFHTVKRIKQLSVVVDGVPSKVFNQSLPEPEAAGAQSQLSDHTGNSLISGFWTTVPFEKVDAPREAQLSLRATLKDGRVEEAQVGTLELLPSEPLEQSLGLMPKKAEAPASPRVIICMATYNPPLDLLVKQIESLKKQTHDNWACIINDDCSDAETYKEIRRIAAPDSQFSVYRNPERLGFYRNFERCLKRVPAGAADFIAFADQDDEWYEDKLASCLKQFDADDVQMVYSDMDIVTREGEVCSNTYWTARRNNYTDLEALLLANTVAGASIVFRSGLLDDLVPFPQIHHTDLFHDHWVACVALTSGRIGYVDRPLYAYRQHANNVIGHVDYPTARLWSEFENLAHTWNLLAGGKNDSIQNLSHLYQTYRALPVRISFIAGLLSLRLKDAPAKKRAVLKRFVAFEYSLAAVTRQALKYLVTRRSSLGLELTCLRAALGMRLFQSYFRQARSQLMNGSPPHAAQAANASHTVDVVRQKIAPLRLKVSGKTVRRINLLVSSIDVKYLFAGYLSVFNLALRLNASGYATRLVIVDYCDYDLKEMSRRLESHDGLRELFKKVETAYVFNRSIPLSVSPQDAFLATSCWTAHIAHQAARELGRARFIYLIQDYEPLFYPGGTFYALAEQALTFPHDALFSTDMLRDYFREQRLGVYADEEAETRVPSPIVFQNAVNHFTVSENKMRERKRRRLLFYARPDATYFARNMFELGVLALRQAISERHFDLHRWEFHGMGAIGKYRNVPLCADAELKLLPKLSLEDYYQALPTYDLGLSLMHTPHPSLTPLDMAAAGLVTVTNTFAAKTAARMSDISSNIIAVPSTIEEVKKGLIQALSEVEDFEKRAQGARLNWSRSWEETFGADVMAAVKQSVGW
jgi:glycosyltransferase involved in cell wall biosynthesis